MLWGGGTRLAIGEPPTRYDIAVDLSDLRGIVEHSPADLVCTVRAGTTMVELAISLHDLPLREFPVAQPHGQFAIMLTGDGGWRRVDEQIAKRLREANVPVVGFLVPDYFRVMRTPEESADALERTIAVYRAQWHCDRVIVIGYSRGADVLPFMINRLPAAADPSK